MSIDFNTCAGCRFYYERETGDSADPLGALCAGCDSQSVQGYCGYNTKEIHTFASRPACRRFDRLALR